MSRQVQIPVTVKTRLGIDDLDSPEFIKNFIETVSTGGCKHFILHARKCWLKGLSPHQNRTVPPLQYDRVKWLCEQFPHLTFSLNGGINTLDHAETFLPGGSFDMPANLTGVMMGRAAFQNPVMFYDVDRRFTGRRKILLPHSRGALF